MKDPSSHRSIPFLPAITSFLAIGAAHTATASPDTQWKCDKVQRCYELLKQFEDSDANRPPNPTKELKLGRLDVATGAFVAAELPIGREHVIPGKYETPEEGTHAGKPVKQPDEKYNDPGVVDAVTVIFTVDLVHHGAQPVTLTCNGRKVKAKKAAASVSCAVGAKESTLAWSLTPGAARDQQRYTFTRPPFITMGAFIIPAIPLGVLYEPPQRSKGISKSANGCTSNCATLSSEHSAGSTVSLSIATSRGETTDGVLGEARAANWSAAADVLKPLSAIAKLIPPPYGEIISGALGIFAAGLGHAEAHDTKSMQALSQTTWSFVVAEGQAVTTREGLGPGLGDVILYQRDVRVAWVGSNKGAYLVLMPNPDNSYGSFAYHSVRELLADRAELIGKPAPATCVPNKQGQAPAGCGSRTGADLRTIEALLRIDPFVDKDFHVNPDAELDPKRFAWTPSITLNGGEYPFAIEHEVSSEDTEAVTLFSNITHEASKGFLSFTGYGPDANRTVVTSIKHTVSKTHAVGDTITVMLDLFADASDLYTFDVFYDRAFGTFAFKRDPATEDRVSGTAVDPAGRPRPFAKVKLTAANGRTFITRTDADGKFRFRSSHLAPGAVTITAEGATPIRARLTPAKLDLKIK